MYYYSRGTIYWNGIFHCKLEFGDVILDFEYLASLVWRLRLLYWPTISFHIYIHSKIPMQVFIFQKHFFFAFGAGGDSFNMSFIDCAISFLNIPSIIHFKMSQFTQRNY